MRIFFIILLLASKAYAVDELAASIKISLSAMKAQSERLKVTAQNIANADSLAENPGEEPYRRKLIFFDNKRDKDINADKVVVKKVVKDRKMPLKRKYDPTHPAADNEGYILLPNVDKTIELMDAKEAQRSFDANVAAIETSKAMVARTMDILR